MNKKETRRIVMQLRFTPTEAEQIYEWAEESEMVLPEYLRRVILRGVTFNIGVNEHREHESPTIERIEEESEVQPKRRHASG